MINLKTGNAVHASQLRDQFDPQCHWIIQPGEPIAAEFVQTLLDKYGPDVKAYAVTQLGSSFCVELQFVDPAIGEQCNLEYVRGWRKGGAVATKKKAQNRKPRKRLPCHRMYVLPDGTEFFYYARWDGHGNLVGKVLAEGEVSSNAQAFVRLENKIVHRSVVEQGVLVPTGNERFRI